MSCGIKFQILFKIVVKRTPFKVIKLLKKEFSINFQKTGKWLISKEEG